MQRGLSEGYDPGLRTGGVPATMNDGIAHAFIGGISHYGIRIHHPSQLEDPEHNGENHHNHHGCFQQTLAALPSRSSFQWTNHIQYKDLMETCRRKIEVAGNTTLNAVPGIMGVTRYPTST